MREEMFDVFFNALRRCSDPPAAARKTAAACGSAI